MNGKGREMAEWKVGDLDQVKKLVLTESNNELSKVYENVSPKNLNNALENINHELTYLWNVILTWRSNVNMSEINMEVLTSFSLLCYRDKFETCSSGSLSLLRMVKVVFLTADSPKPILLLYQS